MARNGSRLRLVRLVSGSCVSLVGIVSGVEMRVVAAQKLKVSVGCEKKEKTTRRVVGLNKDPYAFFHSSVYTALRLPLSR